MSSQGEPSSGKADGAWWDALYEGPDDEIPDIPGADPRQGTVDERFDSASGVVSGRAAAVGPPTVVDAPVQSPGVPAQAPPPPANRPVIPPLTPQFRQPSFAAPPSRRPAPPAAPPASPPAAEAAEPPLPPLPVRPPRIPSQSPDPRVSGPRPSEPADRYDADSLEDEDYEAYEEPKAVREARTAAPEAPAVPEDRPVRDLDEVRDANAEAAAEETAEPGPAEPLPQVGEQPPAYEPEPTELPVADPDQLTGIVPDTALDGARYGTMTLRAASVRGDAARHHGSGRSDRLMTLRFGEGSEALLLVVLATPPDPENPTPADEACRQLAAAIGRSRAELLADLRVGAQERLRYGLQRLTARAAVRLQNVPYPSVGSDDGGSGALHALIAPLDPTSRLRAGFGVGPGGLLLLGDDAWYDAYAGRRLVARQPGAGSTVGGVPPYDRFRFRVVVPEPGDVLLLCSDGLAQPLREEPAVSDFLADHWAHPHPPGTVDFLRQVQVRAKGYASDRTAAAIWED